MNGTPDPSTLAFLFGDRLVRKAPAMTAGIPRHEIPCSGTKVLKERLAETLFVTAFWALREERAIELHVADEPAADGTPQALVAPRARPSHTGLEGGILERLYAAPAGEKSVRFVVFSWFGTRPVNDPHGVTIEAVTRVAASHGALEAKIRGGRVRKVKPNCEWIAGVRPAFEMQRARWVEFHAREPELFAALIASSARGFAERRPMKETTQPGLHELMQSLELMHDPPYQP